MNVLLTGATGFIGSQLSRRLKAAGHTVVPLGRRPGAAYDWSEAKLRQAVYATDAVIHLAGESLFAKRWSPRQKQVIRQSRVDPTSRIAAIIAERKPQCFISTSAVGYYGPGQDEHFDENSAAGGDFLAGVCRDWESSTAMARSAGVRTAIVRTGVVLGRDGGALAKMLPPFRLGLGGPLGNGRQFMSWIHIDDLTALYLFLLENPLANGFFNAVAPHPVRMAEFAKALGRALHRPAFFPVPAAVLRLALGEVADILLTGQFVEARRAQEAGFNFKFAEIDAALSDLLQRS